VGTLGVWLLQNVQKLTQVLDVAAGMGPRRPGEGQAREGTDACASSSAIGCLTNLPPMALEGASRSCIPNAGKCPLLPITFHRASPARTEVALCKILLRHCRALSPIHKHFVKVYFVNSRATMLVLVRTGPSRVGCGFLLVTTCLYLAASLQTSGCVCRPASGIFLLPQRTPHVGALPAFLATL
jgi:hypothetical protein